MPLNLVVDGALDRTTVARWHRELTGALPAQDAGAVTLDLARVTAMDSVGAALCAVLRQRVHRAGGTLKLAEASTSARAALAVFRLRAEASAAAPSRGSFFERFGGLGYGLRDETLHFLVLAADTFAFAATSIGRRARTSVSSVTEQLVRHGLESVGIVCLIAFLVGLVIALQSAVQLQQFGANLYIVDLTAVGMTRELGPLMTAIILSGRSGSAIAAELATMTITEEIDALKTMGVQPVRFLVVPRFWAMTIGQPLLTVLADVAGILGGFLIAVLYLQLSAEVFVDRLFETLVLKDILTGLIKSVAFAWIIVFVGAHRGFRVTGGAEGVGKATTRSVVHAIFLVIVADAFFSVLFYFRPGG